MARQREPVKTVGGRIREIREVRGMSLEALAAAIGTDGGTMSRIERDLAGLDYWRAQRIADVLGVALDQLDPIRFPRLTLKRRARRTASAA